MTGSHLCPAAKQIYKLVYRQMINKQFRLKHPQQPVMEHELWKTICHNAAYIVASAYEGTTIVAGGIDLLKRNKK